MLAALCFPAALGLAGVVLWLRDQRAISTAVEIEESRPVLDGLATADWIESSEPQTDVLVLLSMRRWDLADEDQPDADEAYREWMRTLDDILEADLTLAALAARDHEEPRP